MSNFEGYMGGDPGQGYHNQDCNANSNANAIAYSPNFNSTQAQAGGGAATTPQQAVQAPHPPGSITKFYQPETLQFASPQLSHSVPYPNPINTFQHQQQGMINTQSQSHPQYQHPHQAVSYQQHAQNIQYPVPPQPTAMSASAPLYAHPQNHPQQYQQPQQQQPQPQSVLAHSQSIAQQQRVPNQMHQTIVPSQPQLPSTSAGTATTTTGSYAARSAQAHATIGPPSSLPAHSAIIPTTQTSVPTVPSPHPQPPPTGSASAAKYDDSPANQAQQNRILTDCTRKVQEHAYYMKQAMDKDELSVVLDRAVQMVGELGDASSGLLTPKNYYELHMRALDDMPNLEEYFISLTAAEGSKYTMRNLYDYVQYCPKVLPRLYVQISAGSALIRSKEESATSVLNELIEAVRCVQNPLRGLFLRHFLLQVTRDKLPDGPQVQDAYEFVLTNLIEMNRLWVRIQHLPGDGKSKEQRKRRERERNELRILVGTNLVRLSQLEGVTSQVYGENILPRILEQIIACGDPLAQAYLIDCIIQVFPDEYHIETLPILLAVCPKLRDKVNVRTIMQSLMDRLANYYADEELLDEADTNEVKKSVARDSFQMFEECVQKVFEARGPKLVSREVIRLQTALLAFSLKCFPENMTQVSRCLGVCINFIRQAANATAIANQTPLLEDSAIQLDEASITELEKMLSIPLDSLALKVLELEHYSDLLQFLPWKNRHDVGMIMLRAIDTSGVAPTNVNEVEELFSILVPVIHNRPSSGVGVGLVDSVQDRDSEVQEEDILVSKLVHLLDHENVEVAYEMVFVARSHLGESGSARIGFTLAPVVFSALRLANRIAFGEDKVNAPATSDPEDGGGVDGDSKNDTVGVTAAAEGGDIELKEAPVTDEIESKLNAAVLEEKPELPVETVPSVRKVLLFVQSTIAMISKGNPELGLKLYLLASLAADKMFCDEKDPAQQDSYRQIVCELLTLAYCLHDEEINDGKAQQRCIVNMVGTLLNCQSVAAKDFATFITKTAQYAAKLTKKQDQCEMVALCSHLFYSFSKEGTKGYQNPQRTLECLQRSLKLADSSVNSDPKNVYLFVDLLEDYLYFFEEGNPVITDAYISGLLALIREHLESVNGLLGMEAHAVADAQSQFLAVCDYIKSKKEDPQTAERFQNVSISLES